MSLDTKVKICVHDFSGILMNEKLEIPAENKIHFCNFCNAAKMLRTEDRTVTDTALECGFETVTYFNRMFRQNFGKTPSEYRREYKK